MYFGDQSRVPPIVPPPNSRHHVANLTMIPGSGIEPMMSSDEDDFNGNNAHGSESEDEGLYSFKRNRNCNYHKVNIFLFCYFCEFVSLFYRQLYFSPSLKALETGRGLAKMKMVKQIKNTDLRLHQYDIRGM